MSEYDTYFVFHEKNTKMMEESVFYSKHPDKRGDFRCDIIAKIK